MVVAAAPPWFSPPEQFPGVGSSALSAPCEARLAEWALGGRTADELRHARSPGSAPALPSLHCQPTSKNLFDFQAVAVAAVCGKLNDWAPSAGASVLRLSHARRRREGHVKLPSCATRSSSSLWEGAIKVLGTEASPPPLRLLAKVWIAQGNPSLLVTEREKIKSVLLQLLWAEMRPFWAKVCVCVGVSTWQWGDKIKWGSKLLLKKSGCDYKQDSQVSLDGHRHWAVNGSLSKGTPWKCGTDAVQKNRSAVWLYKYSSGATFKILRMGRIPKEKKLAGLNAALEAGGEELAEGIYASPAGTIS